MVSFSILSAYIISGPRDSILIIPVTIIYSLKSLFEINLIRLLGRAYFSSGWNILDVVGSVSINVYSGMWMAGLTQTLACQRFLLMGTITNGGLAISSFRIVKSFMFMILLMVRIAKNSLQFLVLLFFFVFVFALADLASLKSSVDLQTSDSADLGRVYLSKYRSLFSNASNRSELEPGYPTDWPLFFAFTIFVNLLMFNMLIAIVADAYDAVRATIDAELCRSKAEILL